MTWACQRFSSLITEPSPSSIPMQMTSSQAATAAPVHILMEQSSLTARGSDPTCNIHIEISTSGITTVRGGAGLGGVGGERGAGDGWAVTGCSDITDTWRRLRYGLCHGPRHGLGLRRCHLRWNRLYRCTCTGFITSVSAALDW